ncbi:hypothetical protein M3Y99_00796000 [Aphelenchoides fujianensis]|nr:hypothetical protein M3Y99_00796000 [Aphelenchoides fujianensis]
MTFDSNAPFCSEREPCGFYSFTLTSKFPLKWVNSWCRCSPEQECVFERTDTKMRVYRQTCALKDALEGGETPSVADALHELQNLPPAEKLEIAELTGAPELGVLERRRRAFFGSRFQ